ncbi:putative T7SS-secreted protein, partial [Lapillicoccus sp.]|uniref:putative T7SS-secreted protein n=1 Tax=Lapillicoccus sp. TaxID=1909287 RepID=UPI00326789C6
MSVESPGLEQALASGAAPEVLVPCDTAGLAEVALTLREHATVLEQAAGSLGRVEVTSWRGDASTRFTDTISVEPGRWLAAADGFIAAAVALEGFLTGMPAARDTARTATTLYLQYKTLVAALTAGQPAGPPPLPDTGNGSVRDRIAIGARLDQLTTATGNAATLASQADALRRKAIDLLAAARAAVSAAGDLTAHALDQAAATAPQARRFFEANIRPAGIIGAGHTALDFAGMIPVLGAVPDAMNAVWFGSEGDTTNAALSVAGMLPLLGDAIIGGRVVRGGVEAADAMAQRALRRLDDGGLGGHE